MIEADTNPFDTSDEEDFVRIMLDGERRGLVRPELDANGQWSWVILRACHVENGMLVDDERPIGRDGMPTPTIILLTGAFIMLAILVVGEAGRS